MVAVFFVGALAARAAPAYDVEAGYQLSPITAPYVSARVNLSLGELGPVGLWLLPEVGATLTDTAKGYTRVQVLADTPICTVGADVRVNEWGRIFVRFNL
jgi:hypothetical protein